jgi:integrase
MMMSESLAPLEGELVPHEVPGGRDYDLSDETIEDLRNSTAENTDTAYGYWWDKATEWCERERRTLLPMTAQTLAEFIGYLRRLRSPKPYAPASLLQAVAAIRTAHFRAGYEDKPHTKAALNVIKVHRRELAKSGWKPKRSEAITLDRLTKMLECCDQATLAGARNATLLVVGYGINGRRSELSFIPIEDVSTDGDWLTIFLALSKTDQEAHGDVIDIPRELSEEIDAISIVENYLKLLAEQGITEGPLLRRISRWGHVGNSLTTVSINNIVKDLAKAAKLPNAERFTAHGLRAGGPTDASERGVPLAYIAEHGRWSKNSTQVLTYVRPGNRRRNNPLLQKKEKP